MDIQGAIPLRRQKRRGDHQSIRSDDQDIGHRACDAVDSILLLEALRLKHRETMVERETLNRARRRLLSAARRTIRLSQNQRNVVSGTPESC